MKYRLMFRFANDSKRQLHVKLGMHLATLFEDLKLARVAAKNKNTTLIEVKLEELVWNDISEQLPNES